VHRLRSSLAQENGTKLELAPQSNNSGLINQNLLDYAGD
jgi:hypothetical protein